MGKNSGGLSLRTKDATSGGGTEGALATISEIGFVDEFTYGGRQKDKPQAAIGVVYTIDGFQKPWDQHFTVGPSDKYEVVSDGDGIRSTGKATGLNDKSAAYAFFAAIEKAAEASNVDIDELLPNDDGYTSVRPLEGRRVRLTNIKFTTVGGDVKELVVPGEFVDDEPATKGKSNGKAAKASSSESVEEKTEAAISKLLEDSPVKKGDLANEVFGANRKDPDVKAMMNLCFKDAWISSDDRPWDFDKKKGVLKARED